MATFSPPGRLERRGNHPLFGRLSRPVGVSLLKEDGFYRQVENPSNEEVAAAEEAFLGGFRYEITSAQADALTLAGYGDWVSGDVLVTYGDGLYGAGNYGG